MSPYLYLLEALEPQRYWVRGIADIPKVCAGTVANFRWVLSRARTDFQNSGLTFQRLEFTAMVADQVPAPAGVVGTHDGRGK